MKRETWLNILRIRDRERNITFIPPVEDGTSKPKLGWLNIDGMIWQIINWHSFDDFGATLDTLTIERGNQVDASKRERKEIFSQDEGETFTFAAH